MFPFCTSSVCSVSLSTSILNSLNQINSTKQKKKKKNLILTKKLRVNCAGFVTLLWLCLQGTIPQTHQKQQGIILNTSSISLFWTDFFMCHVANVKYYSVWKQGWILPVPQLAYGSPGSTAAFLPLSMYFPHRQSQYGLELCCVCSIKRVLN